MAAVISPLLYSGCLIIYLNKCFPRKSETAEPRKKINLEVYEIFLHCDTYEAIVNKFLRCPELTPSPQSIA